MPVQLPKIAALANLPTPPPAGSLQFFDGYYPSLPANSEGYTITVTHTMSGNAGVPGQFQVQQTVSVQGPEFTIDAGIVQSNYPPNGGSDQYEQQLPFVVLTDPSLPWERNLTPGSGLPGPTNPAPWMALLIFAEGEIYLQPGSNNPVASVTVQQLLAPNPDVLKPALPAGWVSAAVLNSQCQAIAIPGAVFNAVVPTTAELPYLAHCRGVNTLDEGEILLSVLLSNRLPQAASNPAAPVRYYAHVVSLEGFAAYMGPNATPIPAKPNSSQLMDVQMVSLYNWSFTCLPESGLSFSALVGGLIASEQPSATQQTTAALQLPVPPSANLPTTVQNRLNEGFAALPFVTGEAENSFAWYRGPFTAAMPQPLPAVEANSADALMIYLESEGLFDLSYAAAWNIGRNLALADASFAQNVTAYRQALSASAAKLAQRGAMSHFSAHHSAPSLLDRHATRKRFTELVGNGLGEAWTEALGSIRAGAKPAPPASRPKSRFARKPLPHPRTALAAAPSAADAISTDLNEIIESVAAWLAKLSLLYPVPFSHMVPDPRMVPAESIRFFYVDQNWIAALNAGALSIAIHGSGDTAAHASLLPTMLRAVERHRRDRMQRVRPDAAVGAGGNGVSMTGVLIRSELISSCPSLVITATLGGAPLNIVRDDCPSPSVRLCIFDGIPDTVSLAQPYKGVLFGVEDKGVYPRCVTATQFTGSQIGNGAPVQPTFRTAAAGSVGGVINVQALAAALTPAVGLTAFASGASVNWNGSALPATYVGPNQLQVAVPANLVAAAGQATITVTSGGATSLPASFVINAALEIDSINPALILAGGNGFTLSVTGVGFAPGSTIQWNGTALTSTVISAEEITAVVAPALVASPATINISVLSNNVTSNTVTLSVVSADPVIDGIEPKVVMAGGAGFTLTVSGSGFGTAAIVNWNGSPLTTAYVNDQQLKAAVPASLIASAGSANVTVTLNAAVSNAVPFTITGSQPTIGSLSPSVALAGAGQFTLVVDGVNFAAGAVVNWNQTPLTPSSASADQLTVTVPANLAASAGNASVTVTSGGVTSNALPFLVVGPQPAIALLDPPEVFAGSGAFTLNIFGGFGAGDFALQMVAAPELQSFPNT